MLWAATPRALPGAFMSNSSLQLALPYIQGGQAQKHVTHNEAIRTLDTVVHLSVVSQATAPDAGAQEGDRYIVAPGGTGDFTGEDGNVAMLETGVWAFFEPRTGWIAFDESTGGTVVFNGNDWTPTVGGANVTSTDRMGVNATADTTNRLAVSAPATLLTGEGAGHQLKINKSAASDTASLLFQTGWSARAEMGTAGTDDFEIKVSPDGSSFFSALTVDRSSGAVSLPNTSLADPSFGPSSLVTQSYVAAASGLVANGTGYLGNGYNYPSTLAFSASDTPNLPGAFVKTGYYSGPEEMTDAIPVDPNRLYRVGAYIRQDLMAGDWSGFANGGRHAHYMGFCCYDADGQRIDAAHHMRHRHGGVDSLTTLAQPLSPGDTSIFVADASGWNESDASAFERGVILFGYADAAGRSYAFYSRLEASDLFELGDVNKSTGEIQLNQPFPGSLGNPGDGGGVWPVGTRIANRSSGWNYKFAVLDDFLPPAADQWYRIDSAIGGLDTSGTNAPANFAPGTVTVRPVWLLNYSNRSGGFGSYPDTGAGQTTRVSGLSVAPDPSGKITAAPDGSATLHILDGDPGTGAVSFIPATPIATQI